MPQTVARLTDQFPWRLQAAWATGEPVSVRYEVDGDVRQAEGYVTHVASSAAFILIRLLSDREDIPPMHVPMDMIVGVHGVGGHFHEGRGRPPRRPPPNQGTLDGQMGLVAPPAVSERAMRYALRGAAEMLPPDVLGVLAALDRAGKRATIAEVAQEAGRSERWTALRIRTLEHRGYCRRIRRRGRRDILLLG